VGDSTIFQVAFDACRPLRPIDASQSQGVPNVSCGRAAKQHRLLEHHGLAAGKLPIGSSASP